MCDRIDKVWLCIDLSMMDYEEAWGLQRSLVTARKERRIDKDIVLLLEHPPVFTLGRRGGLENLRVSGNIFEKTGIPVIKVERGGNITFHGPGQLIVYPIIDLRVARLKVIKYIEDLEEIMIRTAADVGIRAERNSLNRGAWVGNNKLGSIGICIRRGISFHGMAFNVNLSLTPFDWIRPCGLGGIQMTSLEQEISNKVSMRIIRQTVKRQIKSVFGVKLVMTSLEELQDCLQIASSLNCLS